MYNSEGWEGEKWYVVKIAAQGLQPACVTGMNGEGWLTESGKRSATVFVTLRNATVALFLRFTKDSVGV